MRSSFRPDRTCLFAVDDVHARVFDGFDDHVTQGRAVFVVEDRDGEVLHAILCDDLAQDAPCTVSGGMVRKK